jgi:hypothetical protein
MKVSLLLTLLNLLQIVVGRGLLERAACNADNCARAITGTNAKPSMTIRRSDCASFMTATFYPASS